MARWRQATLVTTDDRHGLDERRFAELQDVLREHGVSFALLFGSASRDSEWRDVDVAFEFETVRPDDDGYSDAYLSLLVALEDRLDADVDLVDVHATSSSFARVIFDDGITLVGSEDRREELARRLAGERPTIDDARDRVASAVERIREGS